MSLKMLFDKAYVKSKAFGWVLIGSGDLLKRLKKIKTVSGKSI